MPAITRLLYSLQPCCARDMLCAHAATQPQKAACGVCWCVRPPVVVHRASHRVCADRQDGRGGCINIQLGSSGLQNSALEGTASARGEVPCENSAVTYRHPSFVRDRKKPPRAHPPLNQSIREGGADCLCPVRAMSTRPAATSLDARRYKPCPSSLPSSFINHFLPRRSLSVVSVPSCILRFSQPTSPPADPRTPAATIDIDLDPRRATSNTTDNASPPPPWVRHRHVPWGVYTRRKWPPQPPLGTSPQFPPPP